MVVDDPRRTPNIDDVGVVIARIVHTRNGLWSAHQKGISLSRNICLVKSSMMFSRVWGEASCGSSRIIFELVHLSAWHVGLDFLPELGAFLRRLAD